MYLDMLHIFYMEGGYYGSSKIEKTFFSYLILFCLIHIQYMFVHGLDALSDNPK